ncbi:hypothetical protein G7K_4139-t1 [Saitoella complicata NRRL Y-17804]|uniref:Uncharacterized protein n=1 Tax=Saitoella complicata (strain BCRC 22490 / CBS 7301 / JCM 7358 / NBRC 10748 / NRRL Y-17804) TaxID=698492 RepID=A0A0E9NJI5_SAICN|nr:hypothetical protein G7K_4139-t1 [Saitoella complicata NRRL Y-17804]
MDMGVLQFLEDLGVFLCGFRFATGQGLAKGTAFDCYGYTHLLCFCCLKHTRTLRYDSIVRYDHRSSTELLSPRISCIKSCNLLITDATRASSRQLGIGASNSYNRQAAVWSSARCGHGCAGADTSMSVRRRDDVDVSSDRLWFGTEVDGGYTYGLRDGPVRRAIPLTISD